MTHIDRIVRHVLHDPWTSRVFLAFTVGLFLSCSAEFAAGQDVTAAHRAVSSFAPPDVPVHDAVGVGSMK